MIFTALLCLVVGTGAATLIAALGHFVPEPMAEGLSHGAAHVIAHAAVGVALIRTRRWQRIAHRRPYVCWVLVCASIAFCAAASLTDLVAESVSRGALLGGSAGAISVLLTRLLEPR